MSKITKLLIVIPLMLIMSCSKKIDTKDRELNALAEDYVRLGLNIGQHDPDFVDAYYGPDSLKPKAGKADVFPKDSLLNSVAGLKNKLIEIYTQLSDTGKI